MKFRDGYWVTKPEYKIHYAENAFEVKADDRAIHVFALSRHPRNRGDLLDGVTFEVTYTSTLENTVKVSYVHHKGAPQPGPNFELNEDPAYRPQITDTEAYAELTSGRTRVRVYRGSWRVEFYYGDRLLTDCGWRAASYIEESPYGVQSRMAAAANRNFWNYPPYPGRAYMREQLNLSVGEYIYGLGERFTPFVKNGQSLETWNADGGTCTPEAYKSVPFYLSSRGYGVLVNSPDNVSFEVASDTVSKVSFTVTGERLEYFLVGGEDPADVLRHYTSLTGKPGLPPARSFGLWLTTSFLTNYDEATVSSFIDGMAARDIPLEMFHFDCFWMREFEWCGFAWDDRAFPDPKAMLDNLKKKGVGICVWVNPYIGQRSALFDEGMAKGYFLRRKDGSLFQSDMWQSGNGIVDFTNPAAREWYAEKIRELCRTGVYSIKTDFGERIPTDVVYYDGSDPVRMHNYYTYLYNKTVYEAIEDVYGKGQACLFARSATVGGQKFPAHWGGDCSAIYPSMAETLRGGLSLCSSGFGFFSHDMGGFEQTASPDVYKRWCAFGCMSTHSRLHGSTSYRVPWAFEEDDPQNPENACAVLRHFVKLKGRLMPYLYAQAVKTAREGVPVMRPMVLDFAGDPACLTLDRQYMFGDNLLCVPVMAADGKVDFYVPEGTWTDVLTGKTYEGGRFHTATCSYLEMPILARPNTVTVFGDFKRGFVYDYAKDAEAVIYRLEESKTASTVVYLADGTEALTLSATRAKDTVTVRYTAMHPLRLTVEGRTLTLPAAETAEVTMPLA